MEDHLAGEVLKTLLSDVKAADKPADRVNYQRFFKEKLDHPVGLRTSVLRGISDRGFKRVKSLEKDAILDVCEGLLARRGLLIREVVGAAGLLLADGEDLVQKGYGWMLKEAGARFFPDVEKFVMVHKVKMPRTALRYAIEKWPAAKRKEVMK